MEGGVVHLQLQDDAEEVVHVPRVGVDQDVRDALLLDLAQHRPREKSQKESRTSALIIWTESQLGSQATKRSA